MTTHTTVPSPITLSQALRQGAVALSLCSLAMLTACGGGGGDNSAPVVIPSTTTGATETPQTEPPAPATSRADAYVGTWRSICIPATESNLSFYVEAVATKVSATQVSVHNNLVGFGGLTCAGPVLSTGDNGTDTYTLTGTTTVGTKLVDQVILTHNSADTKSLAYTDGSTLLFGNTATGSAVDSNGYPTSLNTAYPFTRQ